jgi:ketosteroid isomerase-like protein
MATDYHPNAELMRRAFAAATGGDVAEFWKHQADNVEAKVAGTGLLSGTYRGKADQDWIPCTTLANLAQFKQPEPSGTEEAAVRLLSVLADEEHAVAIYTVKTRDGDELGAVVGRVREGQFARVWHFDPIIEKGLAALAGGKDPNPPPPKPKAFTT